MSRAACRAVPARLRPVLGAVALFALAACANTGQVARAAKVPALPSGVALLGLAGGEVEGVMGEPTLIRADGPAQYWRYGLGGCQLDLFLYADRAAGRPASPISTCGRRAAPTAPTRAGCAELARRLRAEPVAAEAPPAAGPLVSQPF